MHLYGIRSQNTIKCGKNILIYWLCLVCLFLLLPLHILTSSVNLFVKYTVTPMWLDQFIKELNYTLKSHSEFLHICHFIFSSSCGRRMRWRLWRRWCPGCRWHVSSCKTYQQDKLPRSLHSGFVPRTQWPGFRVEGGKNGKEKGRLMKGLGREVFPFFSSSLLETSLY